MGTKPRSYPALGAGVGPIPARSILSGIIALLPMLVASFNPYDWYWAVAPSVIWIYTIGQSRFRLDYVSVLGSLLVFAGFYSAGAGLFPDYSMRVQLVQTASILYLFAIRDFASRKEGAGRELIVSMLVICAVHFAYFIFGGETLTAQYSSLERVMLEGVNANISGWIFAIGAWLALTLLAIDGRALSSRNSVFCLLTLIAMISGIFQVQSRTSLVSVVLASLFLGLRLRPAIAYALALIVFGSATVASLMPSRLLTPLALQAAELPVVDALALGRGGQDGISGRSDIWDSAASLLPDLPWHGLGSGGYVYYIGVEGTMHNFVLEAWLGTGLVGVCIYVLFLIAVFVSPARGPIAARGSAYVLVASGIGLLIPTFLGNTQFWVPPTAVVLGLLAATGAFPTRPHLDDLPARRTSAGPVNRGQGHELNLAMNAAIPRRHNSPVPRRQSDDLVRKTRSD